MSEDSVWYRALGQVGQELNKYKSKECDKVMMDCNSCEETTESDDGCNTQNMEIRAYNRILSWISSVSTVHRQGKKSSLRSS